jgi:peptidoglycan/LPS O-acetylase OafA/YrhL
VLSGYLITGVLLQERASPHYYRNFYARRALRIFPVYYLAVAAALLLFPHLPTAEGGSGWGPYPARVQVWFWLNVSNLLTAFSPMIVPPLTHFWSLGIEEQFYFVWPAVVRRMHKRTLIWVAALLLVLCEVLRNLPWMLQVQARHDNFFYRLTPTHLDGLLCGALVAALLRTGEGGGQRLRGWFARVGGGCVLLTMALAWWLSPAGWALFLQRWVFLFAAVFFAALLGSLLVRGPLFAPARWLSAGWLRGVGALSYCLYVVHLTGLHVAGLVVARVPGVGLTGRIQLTALLGLAISLGVAMLSRVLIEQPVLRLKRFFR